MTAHRLLLTCLTVSVLLMGCVGSPQSLPSSPTDAGLTPVSEQAEPPLAAAETPILLIPLRGAILSAKAEVSSMAWSGDRLVILPQYPGRFPNDGYGSLFLLGKQELRAAVSAQVTPTLAPQPMCFDDGGLSTSVTGFEGFEAIAFNGPRAYLTIEASPAGEMMGYIVTGTVAADYSFLELHPESLREIRPQAPLQNYSDESIAVTGDRILTFYEANGVNVNPEPVAHVFDADLNSLDPIAFPTLEYRVTDASEVQLDGCFWVINYFFPGDRPKLKPGPDQIMLQFPAGATHRTSEQVERLLPLCYTEAGIVIDETAPVQLLLDSEESRNWEGLVVLEDLGFLLMTDLYPDTLLGFVSTPKP